MTRHTRTVGPSAITEVLVILLFLITFVGSIWYEGSVIYHCHQTKGTLVRSYWTKLPKCVEPKP